MATKKRLIDADEAYEIARTSGLHDDFGRCMADLTSLKELLEDAPTVDAVEVVRCKACQHWQKRHETRGICLKHNAIVTFTTPDFYCACGERRTDHV